MTDIDRLDQRLSAVERVVVDGDVPLDQLAELTALAERVPTLETRLEEQDRRIAELEAAVQSIESYVGNVESINEDVERRAASAVATVDRLERRVEALEVELDEVRGGVLVDDATEDVGSVSDEDEGEGEDETDIESGQGDEDDDAENEDGVAFQFGTVSEGEPTPEQSVAEIVDGGDEPRTIVDDGTDRPVSSANQASIDAALGDEETSVPATTADRTDRPTDDRDDSLLDTFRNRLS